MSDLELVSKFETGERTSGVSAVPVELRRLRNDGKVPVLLLHGASACHESFTIGHTMSLTEYLCAEKYEPWLLDWRGSGRLVDELRDQRGGLVRFPDQFTFDHAAKWDIPAALRRIRDETKAPRIAAVGHCMGAASLAQSIAAGHTKDSGLTHVVLLALGLFYEPAFDGRIKSQDHVLERARQEKGLVVDPRGEGWSSELQALYDAWSLRPHPVPDGHLDESERECIEMCNRISFMYGPPYREKNLPASIHKEHLRRQFGAIPLQMYIHGAQNIRRGWAAPFDARDNDMSLIGGAARDRFKKLESITLMTGAHNQLWHRDSIDRMYEWLLRRPPRNRVVRKEILPAYEHQDMLWGLDAPATVFPVIKAGLPRP